MNRKTRDRAVAIQITDIGKKYEIHHERPTFVEKIVKKNNETFWALKHINLTIYEGDKLGIIGPNGSGKTTLMKIISGICTPTTGTVKTSGKIVTLIDLDAGFHHDLTGIQNIFLNGMLLGMSKQQLMHDLQSIIRYADIKQFIDAPLYTYSQGMVLRLGFAVAIHANPKLFILDEGFLVGDAHFRAKVRKTLQSRYNNGEALILSTHSVDILQEQCNRIIIMNHGSIVYDGGLEAITEYDNIIP